MGKKILLNRMKRNPFFMVGSSIVLGCSFDTKLPRYLFSLTLKQIPLAKSY